MKGNNKVDIVYIPRGSDFEREALQIDGKTINAVLDILAFLKYTEEEWGELEGAGRDMIGLLGEQIQSEGPTLMEQFVLTAMIAKSMLLTNYGIYMQMGLEFDLARIEDRGSE